MTNAFVLGIAIAVAAPSPEQVLEHEPRYVLGFPELEGPPACRFRFEFEESSGVWIHHQHGFTAPRGNAELDKLLEGEPEWFMPYFKWGSVGYYDWRIVDERGQTVTSFWRNYAIDARPFAECVDALPTVLGRRAAVSCDARSESSVGCWSVIELWLHWLDWKDLNCRSPEDRLNGQGPEHQPLPAHPPIVTRNGKQVACRF